MLMIDLTDASCLEFAKFLLDKSANPNISDLDGNTALHMLAGYK
jgi:ankyrin repeat protein